MTRIHIICEGQTEEAFVNNLLVPYFALRGIILHPSLIGKVAVLASDAMPSVRENSPKPVLRVKADPVVAPSVCREIKPKTKAQVLEEAEKLRQTLRESLVGVNDLIREIKAQRRQDKLLRDTVASLRKLQGV